MFEICSPDVRFFISKEMKHQEPQPKTSSFEYYSLHNMAKHSTKLQRQRYNKVFRKKNLEEENGSPMCSTSSSSSSSSGSNCGSSSSGGGGSGSNGGSSSRSSGRGSNGGGGGGGDGSNSSSSSSSSRHTVPLILNLGTIMRLMVNITPRPPQNPGTPCTGNCVCCRAVWIHPLSLPAFEKTIQPSYAMDNGDFIYGGKAAGTVTLTTHLHLVSKLKNSWSNTSLHCTVHLPVPVLNLLAPVLIF